MKLAVPTYPNLVVSLFLACGPKTSKSCNSPSYKTCRFDTSTSYIPPLIKLVVPTHPNLVVTLLIKLVVPTHPNLVVPPLIKLVVPTHQSLVVSPLKSL